MATFLAHIKVHEGKEKRFEIAGRELFLATHDKEDEVVRYEYWRGEKPQTYYVLASFKDYLGFLLVPATSKTQSFHQKPLLAETPLTYEE